MNRRHFSELAVKLFSAIGLLQCCQQDALGVQSAENSEATSAKNADSFASPRVWVNRKKRSIEFGVGVSSTKYGPSPQVSEEEVQQIVTTPGLEGLSIGTCLIVRQRLELVLEKHNLTQILLAYGDDEICCALSTHLTLQSIGIRSGSVSRYGLNQLLKIPTLQSLGVASTLLSEEDVSFLSQQKPSLVVHLGRFSMQKLN